MTSRDRIRELKGRGRECSHAGDLDGARVLYAEAVALCRDEGHPPLLAHTVRHLGDVHRRAGRLDEARTCYEEALAVYRDDAATNPLDLANTLRPFAILEEGTGHPDAARRFWAEARALYAGVGVAEGVREAEQHLAELTSADGDG